MGTNKSEQKRVQGEEINWDDILREIEQFQFLIDKYIVPE